MKTKVVKSILSVGLIFSMVLSLFSGLTVSAEDADPTVEYLFYADFEGQTENNAPTNFYKDDATHNYTYDATKEAVSSDYAVISKDSTHGNYLELKPASPAQRAKVFLNEAVDSSDGTIVIEYDCRLDLNWSPINGQKEMYATFTGQNKNRATIDNQASMILNNKGSDVGNAHGFKAVFYTADGTADNRYSGTEDPRTIYYYNDTTKSDPIKRVTNNTWQHYKMELNLATGTQQLWLDGKASEIWCDKNLYAKIKWEGFSIDAISFRNYSSGGNNTSWLFDNIKVYKKDTAETSPFSGEITQNTKTGVVTANFTSAMKLDGIALYDADGNDVTKSVILTADRKTATITPNTATKGLYYVKVGTYAGGTVPAQTEKTVELNWEKEPTSYLFYEDFTTQQAGSAPTGFYKDDSTHNYKYTDATKEAVSSDYAFISNDTTHGNYLELVPTYPQQRAKVFLSDAVDKSDGTIVIEYDGLINMNGHGNNGRKYINATITGQNKDRTTIRTQASELLNNKGSDVGNAQGFSELVQITDGTYNHSYDETYDGRKDADGTQKSNGRLLYYYNDPIKNKYDNESNCIQRTDNTWQHYKMELNLATGTQQLWIDGKASEIWQDKNLHAMIRWEEFSMDAISFMNYTDSGVTGYTNWLIDNIKVYKKDTADTSPFETITSEKNGDVTVKFGYAVNAADLSVYNADGEKINGKFVMSEDNKTATFTPDRIEDDGLYYVKAAKLASGTVTSQTTKEFTYAPGRTKMVISGLDTVVGTIAPTFTLTHTDGAAKEVVMIVAAYKGGKLVKADVKTESLTTEDKTGAVATVPTIELADGEADTVKAFAWIGGTNVPICNAGVYTTINN